MYRKIDNPDWRLMYYSFRKEWIVQQTSGKGTDNGRAYFKCVPPCLPENGPKGTWQVADGDGGNTQLKQLPK